MCQDAFICVAYLWAFWECIQTCRRICTQRSPVSYRQWHCLQVMATSRADYAQAATAAGVTFYSDANDLCEEHPEVVVLATSILSLEAVLSALPIARLKRSTLIVDVLSVKEFPKRLMLSLLPPEARLLTAPGCSLPYGPAGMVVSPQTWAAVPTALALLCTALLSKGAVSGTAILIRKPVLCRMLIPYGGIGTARQLHHCHPRSFEP